MSESFNEEITVRDVIKRLAEYYRFIKDRWKLVAIAVFLGALIGVYMAYREKTTFKAVLSFALDEENSAGAGGGGLSSLASQFGFDAAGNAGGAFSSQNLIALMRSRKVIENTLLREVIVGKENISLAEFYLRYRGVREAWKEKPGMSSMQFPPKADRSNFSQAQDSVLGGIYAYILSPKSNFLTISQLDKKTSIIVVQVNSENELFAKLFAENLVKEISEFYSKTKSEKAKLNLDILQKQTDSIRAELYSALTGVAVGNDNAFNLNPAYNVMRVPSSKRQVDVQANTAMLTQLVQNLELAKVNLRKETPLLQLIDRPIFPLNIQAASKRKYAITGAIIAGFIMTALLSVFKMVKQY